MKRKVGLPLDSFGRQFFRSASIILVTTLSPSGVPNVAPKTQVMPVGRRGYWAFACCDRHHTYQNVLQQGEFVINIPGPELIEQVSRAAAEFPPGTDEIKGAGLTGFPSQVVEVPSIAECRVHMEFKKDWIQDGFGEESLIIGEVVGVTVDEDLVDAGVEILGEYPLLVYVYPGHYAAIEGAEKFVFPKNYKP